MGEVVVKQGREGGGGKEVSWDGFLVGGGEFFFFLFFLLEGGMKRVGFHFFAK